MRKMDRVYVCAPQLDYDTFLTDDTNTHLTCYLNGLRECVSRLSDLGATKEQSEEFAGLLKRGLVDLSVQSEL